MLDRYLNLRTLLALELLLGCSAALLPAHAIAQPIACTTTDDCPLALECETTRIVESCPTSPGAGGSTPQPDGGCMRSEEPVEEPSCIYAPTPCTEDAECENDLVCQAIGREGECMSNGAGEPICTERYVSYCFPMRRDCASSSECDAGWRCTPLPESAFDDPPAGWEGATKICVPEGIALVLEGRVEVSATRTSVAEERASEQNGGPGSSPSMDDDAGSGGAGGCAVFRAGRSAQRSIVGAMLLCALALLRERRRA